MTDHKWSLKMPRPAPYRAHCLWRNALHASAPWVWGWRSDDRQAEFDDETGTRATWENAIPTTAAPNVTLVHGRSHGVAADAGTRIKWGDTGTRYDITRNFSAAVLVAPNALTSATDVPIYKRRGSPYGATNAGWHFSAGAGNTWRFALSDGTTEVAAVTSRTMSVGRSDLLVATYDQANLNLYMQAEIKGTAAGTIASPNPAGQAIGFLGVGPAGATFDGSIGMAMFWNRVLTLGELSMLANDPFLPWRSSEGDELGALDYQTFLAAF